MYPDSPELTGSGRQPPEPVSHSLPRGGSGLSFHLSPVPVNHVHEAPMMRCLGRRVAK